MKTLVIGLGNPILGDDGIGWKVAETLKSQINADIDVDIDCLSLGGISLMEHLVGYERAILIDAFISKDGVGSILVLRLNDLPNYSAFHTTSPHDTSLQNAIELGKSMGAKLPDEITVVGVTINPIYEFSETLSPPVEEAVPWVTNIVFDLLKEQINNKEESYHKA